MNSVSWFLYIAQVADSLGSLFVFLGVVGLIGVGAAYVVPRINGAIDGADDYVGPPLKSGWLTATIFSLVVGNLMPQKNTMYAIAASQVGEQIVKTEIASDATKALHQWIKKQIEPETKK